MSHIGKQQGNTPTTGRVDHHSDIVIICQKSMADLPPRRLPKWSLHLRAMLRPQRTGQERQHDQASCKTLLGKKEKAKSVCCSEENGVESVFPA
jgi:hypothetical protein